MHGHKELHESRLLLKLRFWCWDSSSFRWQCASAAAQQSLAERCQLRTAECVCLWRVARQALQKCHLKQPVITTTTSIRQQELNVLGFLEQASIGNYRYGLMPSTATAHQPCQVISGELMRCGSPAWLRLDKQQRSGEQRAWNQDAGGCCFVNRH